MNRSCTIYIALALSAVCSAQSARAQVTYTYTGNPFSYIGTGYPVTGISGSFTVSNALAANTTYNFLNANYTLKSSLVSFTLMDGRSTDTVNNGNYLPSGNSFESSSELPSFQVTTGASGNIASWNLTVYSSYSQLWTIDSGANVSDQVTANPTQAYDAYILNSPGSWSVSPAPEPGTIALLGVGLSGLALVRKRRHGGAN